MSAKGGVRGESTQVAGVGPPTRRRVSEGLETFFFSFIRLLTRPHTPPGSPPTFPRQSSQAIEARELGLFLSDTWPRKPS